MFSVVTTYSACLPLFRILFSSEILLLCLYFRFWYISLVACYRDPETCQWKHLDEEAELSYNIWFVNGNPNVSGNNPVLYQFSFDRQVCVAF